MDALEALIRHVARLPGLGSRSAQRICLHLLKRKEQELVPLQQMLARVSETIRSCARCGALTTEQETCQLCQNPKRKSDALCVVEDMADLWAIERAQCFHGRYHLLGGVLSALDGIGPEELHLSSLVARCKEEAVQEVILALSATIEGQTTIHYIRTQLASLPIRVSVLALGMPIGGEVNYLDEGTLNTAFQARRVLE
ncbi:MAG: recombination mediator RecR [Holosporales bacterium]|jgi:recombination protein RecR|nr:recombination mediator RecR [Holosporales bacterium]